MKFDLNDLTKSRTKCIKVLSDNYKKQFELVNNKFQKFIMLYQDEMWMVEEHYNQYIDFGRLIKLSHKRCIYLQFKTLYAIKNPNDSNHSLFTTDKVIAKKLKSISECDCLIYLHDLPFSTDGLEITEIDATMRAANQ